MSAGLSDGFVYAPKPPAAPAANIRVSVPPHNKDSFKDGDVIMFNIPSGKRGQYLNTRMSYLKFDLEVTTDMTGTASAYKPVLALDGGAHALFQNLEVYHGSNLLEQIREYNALYQLLFDMGETSSGRMNGRTVAEGIKTHVSSDTGDQVVSNIGSGDGRLGNLVSPVIVDDQFNSDPYKVDYYPVKYVDRLEDLSRANHLVTLGTGTDQWSHPVGAVRGKSTVVTSYCHPLVSGIVGGQQSKYLPVGGLATDLRLELTVAPFEHAFKAIGCVVQTNRGTDATGTGTGSVAATKPSANLKAGLCDDTQHTASGLFNDTAASTNGGSYFTADPATLLTMSDTGAMRDIAIRITNAELVLEYIEVSSDVQMAIEGSTGGNYILSFESWSNFQNTIKTNPGSIAQLIGAKFSSIKTASTIFRDQYMINRLGFASITSRLNPFNVRPNREDDIRTHIMPYLGSKWASGTGWYYQVGATHYPPKPITSDEESWMEAVKSQHAVAVMQMPGNINKDTWGVSARRDADNDATSDANPKYWWHYPLQGGTFFCAQNFESQSHKSHLTESGINTLAQSMYLVARFPPESSISGQYLSNAAAGAYFPLAKGGGASGVDSTKPWKQTNQGLQLDTYIHYDGILLISNGICSTRF